MMGHKYIKSSDVLAINQDYIENEANYSDIIFEEQLSENEISQMLSSFDETNFEKPTILAPPPQKTNKPVKNFKRQKKQQPKPNTHHSICMYDRDR